MRIADLLSFGQERSKLREKAVFAGGEVEVRLVPEGVLADIRACLAAPVPPKEENPLLWQIFHAECVADGERMKLLELAAAAGITTEISATKPGKEPGSALIGVRGEMDAVECAEYDNAMPENGCVALWVERVLPVISGLAPTDVRPLREAYARLCKHGGDDLKDVVEAGAKN